MCSWDEKASTKIQKALELEILAFIGDAQKVVLNIVHVQHLVPEVLCKHVRIHSNINFLCTLCISPAHPMQTPEPFLALHCCTLYLFSFCACAMFEKLGVRLVLCFNIWT